ncbi:hypothetical protein OAT67_00790 [Bacteriovoracaceae bacterium]|nr:hypothetical protein [Bacteriovoracaceae bacterium]
MAEVSRPFIYSIKDQEYRDNSVQASTIMKLLSAIHPSLTYKDIVKKYSNNRHFGKKISTSYTVKMFEEENLTNCPKIIKHLLEDRKGWQVATKLLSKKGVTKEYVLENGGKSIYSILKLGALKKEVESDSEFSYFRYGKDVRLGLNTSLKLAKHFVNDSFQISSDDQILSTMFWDVDKKKIKHEARRILIKAQNDLAKLYRSNPGTDVIMTCIQHDSIEYDHDAEFETYSRKNMGHED